jgi:hypothetical protein
MRILPKDTANPYLDRTDVLILVETIAGDFVMSYYVRKPFEGIYSISDWADRRPYKVDIDKLKEILTWGELSKVCTAIEIFLGYKPDTANSSDLERSWNSQKEHNQSDTPTSQDKIIASLVAQVNGLATNLSNLQGEMQAHKTTNAKEKAWIVSTFAELRKEVYRVEQDYFDVDKKIEDLKVLSASSFGVQGENIDLRINGIQKRIDGRIDDLDSRINGHIKLENAGLGSIVDRLNEIEVELHNNPGKVLDWAHVNELFAKLDSKIDVRCDAILKELRQEMGNVRPRIAGIEHASIPKLKIDIDAVFSGLIALAKIVDDRSKIR